MSYAAVTTMSQANYEQYGEKFLDTYIEFWDIPIHVYWEGTDFPSKDSDLIVWHDLNQDRDRAIFLKEYGDKVDKDYRYNATKFCHKVFALTDPKRLDQSDVWIWLDADIETFSTVSEEWLDEVCPAGFIGSYLGRTDWHHSECGFVSFNMDEGAGGLLQGMREVYSSGELFRLKEWHDSFVFDTLRRGWWFNISSGIAGMHVFDDSYLGTKLRHAKGELRKQGKALDNLPPGYASDRELAGNKSVATLEGQQLLVKTKNCVPDNSIRAHVAYTAELADPDRYLLKCAPSMDEVIIMVSAGPSLHEYLPQIAELAEKPNHKVVAVKHAVGTLRAYGIKPWACILLDPRSHVADFVDTEDTELLYFVSSMSHPSTMELLKNNGLNYWIYHAHVGAGEDETLRNHFGGNQGTFMVSGGCSTALRGISVLRVLGFRRFKLFAYDLCYDTVEEGAENAFKNTQYMTVNVEGREFHTDAEKVAQVQDFKNLMNHMEDVHIEAYGPGIVPHYWNATREILPSYKDALSAGNIPAPGSS